MIRRTWRQLSLGVAFCCALPACGSDDNATSDTAATDAGLDTSTDSPSDSGLSDGAISDSSLSDITAYDSSLPDGEASESGLPDGAIADAAKPDAPPASGPTLTVKPAEIDDILYNPGIGFADFGGSTPQSEYPAGDVAYRRWTWADLEPAEGQYNFAVVDSAIAAAKAKGRELAFRIMPVSKTSTPQWLLNKGVGSVASTDGAFPDHNNPTFLQYHKKLVEAFGQKYNGSLDIDHVDIGSVGCWGEWTAACCAAAQKPTCDSYMPNDASQKAIIDVYLQAFSKTPLVALVAAGNYAESKGTGWRGDCFGNYAQGWNHMEDRYEVALKDPIMAGAWQHGPVQFESCGVMQDWLDAGYDIDLILQKGLDWHMSVFNGKSSAVPTAWRPKVDEWLKHLGYRMVLAELTHTTKLRAGESLSLQSHWENKGVAPPYHPWPIAWRLRSSSDSTVAQWSSPVDLRTWLPGTHDLDDLAVVPQNVPTGTYALDVAILAEDSSAAHVQLAIAGKRTDLWYPVSQVVVVP